MTTKRNRTALPDETAAGFTILWDRAPATAAIALTAGRIASLRLASGEGRAEKTSFTLTPGLPAAVEIRVSGVRLGPGAHPTLVRVTTAANPFTFFLRDVKTGRPVFIPALGVAVTAAGEFGDYAAVATAVRGQGLVSEMQQIATAPEETYEAACAKNRDLRCPTWLGLSRDMRIFEMGYCPEFGFWGYVQPRYHSVLQNIPETGGKPYQIAFCVGPGALCRYRLTRRLEDGVLPILHSLQTDDEVQYRLLAFATLETQPLAAERIRGSDWRAVYPNTGGNMLTADEKAAVMNEIGHAEMREREEETVCCIRVAALNTGRVPRYAWFRTAAVQGPLQKPASHDGTNGFGQLDSGRVFAVSRLNGKPLPQPEIAILLEPGETARFELLIPHQPLPAARAARLATLNIEKHHRACRQFWRTKLTEGAQIQVPEPAIQERLQAGLLHCDLVALGREPKGPVAATIGWYSPIGSESSPIIQFFDSMGWHKLAERSLQFFLERQRPDGFIQNFGGYQLETGPALWSMGEHYRYTRDDAWVRRIKPGVLKACEYLLRWRDRNKRDELRGNGYGLIDGKVADPEDFFHSFMLNGVSCLGIQRAAEMLARVAPTDAARLAREADAYRRDIRTAFQEAVARAPVIPLGDGTWVPAAPPWTEYSGPLALYAEGGNWYTHGGFGCRDALIGAMYLVLGEVLDPDEPLTEWLLRAQQVLFTRDNAGLSQPYYCRHDIAHLRRGEVKAFLKTYYNQFTALQDRETYTFWEHYWFASQHKTHEEGWFLMQTRWMLYLEEGNALHLLRGIPRRWLTPGCAIDLREVATYFGPVSLHVESWSDEELVEAEIECHTRRAPKQVRIRLPHPEHRLPLSIEGGSYDAATETVTVTPFHTRATVRLRFG